LRTTILENVQKVRDCRNPDRMGYHRYVCPNGCDEVIVPHSCKSRFCSSCGKVATDRWMEERMADLLDVPHHHVVFTVPKELWGLFASHRPLLGVLFTAAKDTVLSVCREQYGYIPGIVMVQHTFGSTLNFNTHIHMLVTEGGLSPDRTTWMQNDFMPWDMLKARWKYHIVTRVKPVLKKLVAEGSVGGAYATLGDRASFFRFLELPIRKDVVRVVGGDARDGRARHAVRRQVRKASGHGGEQDQGV